MIDHRLIGERVVRAAEESRDRIPVEFYIHGTDPDDVWSVTVRDISPRMRRAKANLLRSAMGLPDVPGNEMR